jgi:hypothetical protein
MVRRVEAFISGKPGEFSAATEVEVINSPRRRFAEQTTHVRFHCDLCGQETETLIAQTKEAGWQFDRHDCKPKTK